MLALQMLNLSKQDQQALIQFLSAEIHRILRAVYGNISKIMVVEWHWKIHSGHREQVMRPDQARPTSFQHLRILHEWRKWFV
jgi:hypothetical protein